MMIDLCTFRTRLSWRLKLVAAAGALAGLVIGAVAFVDNASAIESSESPIAYEAQNGAPDDVRELDYKAQGAQTQSCGLRSKHLRAHRDQPMWALVLEGCTPNNADNIGETEYNSATGRFAVYDTRSDGRFVWGRFAKCVAYDYYGACSDWKRIANLMAPRYGESRHSYPSVTRGTPVRMQTCVSAKHDRRNVVYCGKVMYSYKR